jgi:Putative Flp pilus-assembly TadE/G-like
MRRLAQQLRRRAADETGAALIFVAIGLPVFIAFGIFVIDVGNWWVHKRHLQVQADAAALAGAREFRFPVCSDKDIVEEAVDYSGGVLSDPDANYTAFDSAPLDYNHQLAASARPSGPTQGLHTQVNTPNPYLRPDPVNRPDDQLPVDQDLADMAATDRKPCSAQMIDVKMTETDIGGRFSPLRFLNVLGFVDYIDAQARVELKALEATTDLLPLAVEDVNPKRVHVWLYDEDTQELLGEAELNPRDPEDGLLMYDNSTAGGGTPIVVDFKRETIDGQDVTKQRVGAVIAFSGNDSIDCAAPGVECYGSAADGVTRIRGFDPPGAGVRLGAVTILKDECADNAYGEHDNGYFSTTCTTATLGVELLGLSGANGAATTNDIRVNAVIQNGNGTSTVPLHWVDTTGRWETTGADRLPIDLGQGTRRIDIEWSQRRGTLNGETCKSAQNQNPCKGTFTNAHKAFSGARPVSGPIKEVRVDVGGITNVNNVQRCTAAETCPQSVVVRVGLAGRLEITPPDSPPVALRISASGPEVYQTQQLNCQPGNENTIDELAYGCDPLYGIKDDQDPCPSKANLHGSPNPPAWECVAVKTGTMNGPVGSGLNERILCVPPNPASNCNGQFGKPQECTSPNRYPNYADGDPRILALFLVPYGSLDLSGSGDTVPIANFAFFYVTGWHSKGGGFDNPCAAPGASIPDVFAPGTDPNDSGVVSGYFIKYVAPNLGGGGDSPCDPDTIGGCVAVMTK